MDHAPFETARGIYCGNCGESMYAAGPECYPSVETDYEGDGDELDESY